MFNFKIDNKKNQGMIKRLAAKIIAEMFAESESTSWQACGDINWNDVTTADIQVPKEQIIQLILSKAGYNCSSDDIKKELDEANKKNRF
jgi:hypothetical protein